MIKDPIQGLVDFANDIKPYHTKIIEVLVDYIYEENMKVRIDDEHKMRILQKYDFDPLNLCSDGYDLQPWDSVYQRTLDSTIDIRTEFPEGFLWIIVPSQQTLAYTTERCYQFKYKQWVRFTNIQFKNGAPSGVGFLGQYWFDKATQKLYLYSGGTWNQIPTTDYFIGNSEIDAPQYPSNSSPYSRPGLMIGSSTNFPVNANILKIISPDIIFIEGNHTSSILSGDEITIINSFGNDGIWRVVDIPISTFVSIYDTNKNLISVPATAIRVVFDRNIPKFGDNSSIFLNLPVGTLYKLPSNVTGGWEVFFPETYVIWDGYAWIEIPLRTHNSVVPPTPFSSYLYKIPTTPSAVGDWAGLEGRYVEWENNQWVARNLISSTATTPPSNPAVGDMYRIPFGSTGAWSRFPENSFVKWNGRYWEQLYLQSDSLSTPPTPYISGLYLVPSGAQGDWTGLDGKYVEWENNQWVVRNLISSTLTSPPANPNTNNIYKIPNNAQGVWRYFYPGTHVRWNGFNWIPIRFRGKTLTVPPAPFSSGLYLVPAGAQGEWEGLDGKYVEWENDRWVARNLASTTTEIAPNELLSLDQRSNFDFPDIKTCASPTTASTKFKEFYTIDIDFPVSPYAQIVNVEPTTSTTEGRFFVQNPNPQNTSKSNNSGSSDYRLSFPRGSKFEIKGSGNNDGMWTVKSIDYINGFTIIVPEESIPRFPVGISIPSDIVEPYGMIVSQMAGFHENISFVFTENTSPGGWGGYDHRVSPTTKIKNIDFANNRIIVHGDLRRFFQPNTVISISKNLGAWNYLITFVDYNNVNDETHITVDRPLVGNLIDSYVSGEPTFLRSIGWGQLPWQTDVPWLTIVDTQLLTGPGVNVIHLFDTVTQQQLSYYNADYFELGGFGNILDQILPL